MSKNKFTIAAFTIAILSLAIPWQFFIIIIIFSFADYIKNS